MITWDEAVLGDHIDLITGYPFKSAHFTTSEDSVRLLKGSVVSQAELDWSGSVGWPSNDTDAYRKFELDIGDVVLAMDRPWLEAGLKYAWITEHDVPCLLVQRVARMRGRNGLDTTFLRYIIGGPDFTNYISPIVTGVTVPHISPRQICSFRFRLPPLSTQSKIAAVLTAYDDLIENNIRRINLLEEMAQRIYREWFVDFRYPGHENVPLRDSELGPIPEGWSLRGLFDVADITFGFPFKSDLFNSDHGLPVIRIRDILTGESVTRTTESPAAGYRVLDGDILIGMDGDFHMGRWSAGEAWLNQRVARLRPASDGICRYGLYLWLQKPIRDWNRAIVGTTVAHLGKRHLELIKVVIAPPSVAATLASALDPIFDMETGLRKAMRHLRSARDLLLPLLISGQVDLSELDIAMPDAAA